MKKQKKFKLFCNIIHLLSIFLFVITTSTLFAQVSNWESRGIGGGGALFYPKVNPHNTDELYIACDMADLFHSTNAGLLWEIVHFRQLKTGSFTNMQFTSDPDILYVRNFEFEGYHWFPVKSTDGGKTWNKLPTDATEDNEIYYVYADTKGTERLIVTTYNDVFFSDDAGETWSNIYSNSEDDAAYLCGVFWDNTNIFIGTSRGLLLSTDNGSSFSISDIPGIPASDGMFSFTGSRQGDTVRLFCTICDRSNLWPNVVVPQEGNYKDILKLDYGISPEWESCKNNLPDDRLFYFVAMSDNNIDIAYMAGTNTTWGFPAVFKTSDGGSIWEDVFLTENNENIITGWAGRRGDYDFWWGGSALGFTVCRSNPDIAIITDYGYPHITTDGGKLWRHMYVLKEDENPAGSETPKGKNYRGIGMENTGCYGITWIDSLNMFVGFSDIMATRSTDGGVSWSKNYSGLRTNTICRILKHPDNDYLYATTSSKHEIYSTIGITDALDDGKGGIAFSTDKGTTWDTLHDFDQPVAWIEFDPNDFNTMYASVIHHETGGIFVSHDLQNDKSSTWEKLSNPPRTEGHPNVIRVLDDGTIVCSYSARRTDAFTASSGVFKSSDGGESWTDCEEPNLRFWTRDLVIDKHDAQQNTWYACVYSGWGGDPNDLGGIYRTTDRGESWKRILELHRIGSCTNHPNNPDILYVASAGDGLLYTKNLTSEDPTFDPVENYRFVNPRQIFFNPYNKSEIWVSSSGYGVTCGTEQNVDIKKGNIVFNKNNFLHVFFNSHTKLLNIKFELDKSMNFNLEIYNIAGKKIKVLAKNKFYKKGLYDLNFRTDIKTSGIYFVNVNGANTGYSKKFFILR